MTRIFTLVLFIFSISFQLYSQDSLEAPPYLKKGDTIAILAPAGILKGRAETIQKAKELAQSWGLNVVLGENLFNQNNHFAGTDDERAEDFQKALDNPNIKAIWAARGGYGSVRLLDRLDFTKFIGNPKWIIGYSDITAFHNHIHNLGFETLHAMMATSLEEKPEEITKTISRILALKTLATYFNIQFSNFQFFFNFFGVLIIVVGFSSFDSYQTLDIVLAGITVATFTTLLNFLFIKIRFEYELTSSLTNQIYIFDFLIAFLVSIYAVDALNILNGLF